ALVIGTVQNGLNLMGVENEIRLIVTGMLLVLAVSIDKLIEKATGQQAFRAAEERTATGQAADCGFEMSPLTRRAPTRRSRATPFINLCRQKTGFAKDEHTNDKAHRHVEGSWRHSGAKARSGAVHEKSLREPCGPDSGAAADRGWRGCQRCGLRL